MRRQRESGSGRAGPLVSALARLVLIVLAGTLAAASLVPLVPTDRPAGATPSSTRRRSCCVNGSSRA
ncbi:hypothetical protein MMR14E_17020 [Methylobacterium mesophilicum]